MLGATGRDAYILLWTGAVVGLYFFPLAPVLNDLAPRWLDRAVTAVAVAVLLAGVLAGVVPSSITGLGPAWHCSPTQPSRSPAGCRRVAPRQPGRPGSPEEIACIHAKSSELRGARAG